MKNKHLVFLFLLTLLIGLALRQAPWQNSTFFQTNLLKIDTAAVQQIQILMPGKYPLYILRGDAAWSAEQDHRSVTLPMIVVQQMLSALADVRSIRSAKSNNPDTLGFAESTAVQISIVQSQKPTETLTIGLETIENSQSASFVQLPKHEGIYLVNNHLRKIFAKSLMDFRSQTIAHLLPGMVQGFRVEGANLDSLLFQKSESTGRWENPHFPASHPDDSVQIWLSKIGQLAKLPFADLFDENHADETFYAKISLGFKDQYEPMTLTFYHWSTRSLPEEISSQQVDRRQIAPFVLHSSQNPTNYFAFADTVLLRQIIRPF